MRGRRKFQDSTKIDVRKASESQYLTSKQPIQNKEVRGGGGISTNNKQTREQERLKTKREQVWT